MLSGISSRELAALPGRAGRPPAESAGRQAGLGRHRRAGAHGAPRRPPDEPADSPGRRLTGTAVPQYGPTTRPRSSWWTGALPMAASQRPAARAAAGWLARAGAPPAALRAGRRPRLSLPRQAGERPLVDAPGPPAASGRGARPGARAPVVPPRLRSLPGLPGRAADREPRAAPGASSPDDPYRRPAPPASRFCPAPDGRLAPVPRWPAVALRAVPPEPPGPAPPRRAAPPAPPRSAVGLRLTPPAALRPVPLVPFRGAPVFRPAPRCHSAGPTAPGPVSPPVPVPLRAARDGGWPAARGPVRRVPPARSGRPVARSRPCSPVTLSSAPTTQFPDSKFPGNTKFRTTQLRPLPAGSGLNRRCPAASYSPTRSPTQYHRR